MSLSAFLAKVSGAGTPSTTSSPAPTPAPTAPAPAPATAGAASSAPAPAATAAPAPDPLAMWGEMFAAKPPAPAVGADGKPVAPPADLFNLDVKNLAKAAEGINMSNVVPQEVVTKALAGDAASFYEALNRSAQVTFMMGLQAAMQSTKSAVDGRFADFGKQVPDTFRKLSVDQTMQSDPLLSNPALAPIVTGLRSQIEAKHPDATPQQIQSAIMEYFKATGITIAKPGSGEGDTSTKKAPGVDWDNFF